MNKNRKLAFPGILFFMREIGNGMNMPCYEIMNFIYAKGNFLKPALYEDVPKAPAC